jgi:hypothetical protein
MPLFSFGKSPQERDKDKLFPALKESVLISDRIYRNFLDDWKARLHRDIPINGIGLLKARLLGASYICIAYRMKWPESKKDFFDFWNMGSGVAYGPFQNDSSYPAVTRQVAGTLVSRYMGDAGIAIVQELTTGSTTSVEHPSQYVNQLVEMTDEALADSVGEEYDCDVFRVLHVGRILTAMDNAALWFQKIK